MIGFICTKDTTEILKEKCITISDEKLLTRNQILILISINVSTFQAVFYDCMRKMLHEFWALEINNKMQKIKRFLNGSFFYPR